MKLKNIIAVALLLVYSMSTLVGVGIFDCGCTNSQQFVVLNVQTTCPPCSKSTESCCSHSERHDEKHDDENDETTDDDEDCCSLSYQYVVVDQLNITKSQSFNNQLKELPLFTLSSASPISGIKECYALAKNHSPPLIFLKLLSSIYMLNYGYDLLGTFRIEIENVSK